MCGQIYWRLSFRPKSQRNSPNRLYKYIEKKQHQGRREKPSNCCTPQKTKSKGGKHLWKPSTGDTAKSYTKERTGRLTGSGFWTDSGSASDRELLFHRKLEKTRFKLSSEEMNLRIKTGDVFAGFH